MVTTRISDGVVAFGEWSTWYRVTGDLSSSVTPVVVVHGGPGCTHDYLLAIADIASSGRPVIHYDQVGSGRSTHLPDRGAEFWTVELFLDELDNVLRLLGVADDYHLLGQSWGGMLAAEHAVRQPEGLRTLVISDSPASMALWRSEATRLRSLLATDVAEALDRHEANGTTGDPQYLAAEQAYYDEYVCRIVPNPPELLVTKSFMEEDATVYNIMNGPNEFYCIGTLRDWSIVDRLPSIIVPTLLMSGRHDEATPATVQPYFDLIGDVRWEIFESSSHMPFVEERERYMRVLGAYLDEHDARVTKTDT